MKTTAKIFVTGATGLIGLSLVRELVKRNFQVKCLVFSREKENQIKELGAEPVYGNIIDLSFLKKAISETEVVFHLAAIRGRTDKSKEDYQAVNIEGTRNILKAAGKQKRIIYCSSVGVLGWPKDKVADQSSHYKLTRGNRNYHWSKIEAEKIMKEAILSDYKVTIIRPTIVYGKNDLDGMIFKLIKMIKQRKYFSIGLGNNFLHLVDVRNLVEAFLLVFNNKVSIGRLYTIGDARVLRIKEITTIISKTLKVNIPLFCIPVFSAKFIALIIEFVFGIIKKEPPIDVYRINLLTKNQRYDISKVQDDLGYQPKFDILDSLPELVDYYNKNNLLN